MFKKNHLRIKTKQNDDSNRTIRQLKKDLRLKSLPTIIECFDNSNIQGSHPTASMVYFKNGKPLKQQYRRYNIKTVVGPDDFSSMTEIIYRRYDRLSKEKKLSPILLLWMEEKVNSMLLVSPLKNLAFTVKFQL